MIPHEHAEAVFATVIEEVAPQCAEELFLRMLTARDAAPEGEADAYVDATRDAYVRILCDDGERLVARLGASPEQIIDFATRLSAAMLVRFVELKAATAQQEGHA